MLGEGRFLRLLRRGRWEYVERANATGVVAVVALTGGGEIVLVEQERPVLERRVIEIPAGLAGDVESEDTLEQAAARELMEETGFAAAEWRRVVDAPPSAGLTNELITFFLATGAYRVAEGGGEGSERITVHVVPLAGVGAWMREREAGGALIDMKLLAGLHIARAETGAASS